MLNKPNAQVKAAIWKSEHKRTDGVIIIDQWIGVVCRKDKVREKLQFHWQREMIVDVESKMVELKKQKNKTKEFLLKPFKKA